MKAGTTSGAMVVLVVVLVARRAHNPKVAGSNPAPATPGRRGPSVLVRRRRDSANASSSRAPQAAGDAARGVDTHPGRGG